MLLDKMFKGIKKFNETKDKLRDLDQSIAKKFSISDKKDAIKENLFKRTDNQTEEQENNEEEIEDSPSPEKTEELVEDTIKVSEHINQNQKNIVDIYGTTGKNQKVGMDELVTTNREIAMHLSDISDQMVDEQDTSIQRTSTNLKPEPVQKLVSNEGKKEDKEQSSILDFLKRFKLKNLRGLLMGLMRFFPMKAIAAAGSIGKFLLSSGGTIMKAIGTKVAEFAKPFIDNLKSMIDGFMNNPIVKKVSGMIGGAVDKVKEVGSKALNKVKGIGSAIGGFFSSAKEKVVAGAKAVKSKVTKTFSSAKAAIKSSIGAKALAYGAKMFSGPASKGAAKMLVKKIPVVSILAGAVFAGQRLMAGDVTGAGLELMSGIASTLPGPGTAASVGIDAALIARDMKKDLEAKGQPVPENIKQAAEAPTQEETATETKEIKPIPVVKPISESTRDIAEEARPASQAATPPVVPVPAPVPEVAAAATYGTQVIMHNGNEIELTPEQSMKLEQAWDESEKDILLNQFAYQYHQKKQAEQKKKDEQKKKQKAEAAPAPAPTSQVITDYKEEYGTQTVMHNGNEVDLTPEQSKALAEAFTDEDRQRLMDQYAYQYHQKKQEKEKAKAKAKATPAPTSQVIADYKEEYGTQVIMHNGNEIELTPEQSKALIEAFTDEDRQRLLDQFAYQYHQKKQAAAEAKKNQESQVKVPPKKTSEEKAKKPIKAKKTKDGWEVGEYIIPFSDAPTAADAERQYREAQSSEEDINAEFDINKENKEAERQRTSKEMAKKNGAGTKQQPAPNVTYNTTTTQAPQEKEPNVREVFTEMN
jgi:hypothetical protein